MTATRHVLLGGHGVIGRETARALRARGLEPVTVGRRPRENDLGPSLVADLLVADDVRRVLRNADVAYLVAGLPYSSRVWQAQWPALVEIAAQTALEEGVHLVYLDNVYAYGRVAGPMSEDTPIKPETRKGAVRAEALRILRATVENGANVTIGRSADFYGPGASTSVVNGFVIDRVVAGKRPTWLLNADQPHSLAYTPDVGEGLALLGIDDRARNQTWHLPTAPALTGRQYVELAGVPADRTWVMGITTLRMGALFSSAARETLEMAYQNVGPYVVDSSRVDRELGLVPTPLADGFAATVTHARMEAR